MSLLAVLVVGYCLVLGFPLYLYFAVVKRADQSMLGKISLALGPLAAFAFVVVPWCTSEPSALLVLSSLVMFSFAKTLETIWATHDASVRQSFHRFCLYFAIPSDVSFPMIHEGVRVQALRRMGYAVFEAVLLCLLMAALHVVGLAAPSLIHVSELWPHSGYLDGRAFLHSGLVYTLESFASFLCIRIFLNGVLLAGAQLAHGDGILVKDCWGDLTFATSLREIWSGWNLVVHTAWYRVIYRPLVASKVVHALSPGSFRGRQVISMISTFIFSGCVHEYLIWCRKGSISGSQVVFFTLQAIILLLEPELFHAPRGRPETRWNSVLRRVLGPCWWTLCLLLTLPIFFHDVGVPLKEFLAA